MFDGGAYRADALAFDEEFTGCEDFACVDFEKARRVENDWRLGKLLCACERRAEEE
jgi:hypothetical protein